MRSEVIDAMRKSPLISSLGDLPEVTAATIFERADSGAEPWRVLSTDGDFYWWKPTNNPHGIESVVFELMVTLLGQAIDAPIPEAATVTIPSHLTESKCFSDGRPIGELGFGSLVIPSVTESSSLKHLDSDGNPHRLPRLFALAELCMAGDLQLLYQDSAAQRAYGFDFGLWVGNLGSEWNIDLLTTGSSTSYIEDDWNGIRLNTDDLLEARSAVNLLTQADFQALPAAIPASWMFSEQLAQDVAEVLWTRKGLTLDSIDRKLEEVS